MLRNLNVWWDRKLVGVLSQDRSGDLAFAYDPEWVESSKTSALSVSLPKRLPPFARRECRPFFAGLLPDESQRRWAAGALGVSDKNDFALLDGLGGDVAGALELLPAEVAPPALAGAGQTSALTDDALVAILDKLPAHPMLAGERGLRLSLAGAQSKLPVVLVDRAVALPIIGQPTTHILKPPIAQLRATTENEAAIMRLAQAIGLDAAEVEPRTARGRPYLLIKRYDRVGDEDGRVRRVHQEDFCQALGIPPERKYAAEGGPVFKDCFELVRRVSARPAQDVLKLLDAAIFSLVVGNADAHGKNFSLLYGDAGPRLAPLYDLLSTVQYPDLTANAAMRIGRAARLEDIDAENWTRFKDDAGTSIPFLRQRIAAVSEAVREKAPEVCEGLAATGLDAGALTRLAANVVERAERLALKAPAVSPARRG